MVIMLELDSRTLALANRSITYGPVGATRPAAERWAPAPGGFRVLETTVSIGAGEATWSAAADLVLRWAVKTRSGFRVSGRPGPMVTGGRYWVTTTVASLQIVEPVEVVDVVRMPDRVGFAYGTLDGHPVSGEEAFIVHRDAKGQVWLTVRSLTRASSRMPWRALFPIVLIAQRLYRRRYLRALNPDRAR